MILTELQCDPGEEADTWADYQVAVAKRDVVEALVELAQLNLGNARLLFARAIRIGRLALSNRQEAERLRVLAMEREVPTCPN